MNLFESGINGLSDSKWSGAKGSAHRLVGIDYRSQPGLIKVHQKLAKNSGSTVTELCKHRVAASDGSTLWFSSESGKTWRESSGTWTLVHTTVPTSGGAACLGAHEFDNWIYWATESYLHRIHVNDLGSTWSTYIYQNWQAFTNGDDTYHPMAEQNLELFIGDKLGIAKVSDPSTADPTPPETHTVTLGSAVDWGGVAGYVNPSEDVYPSLLTSVREADVYPRTGVSVTSSVLVVAGGGGGGGGGAGGGGGGGAGGVIDDTYDLDEGNYTVTVGAGGAGGSGSGVPGTSGSNSSLGSVAVAIGGGGGGAGGTSTNGLNGGSGGGAGTGGSAGTGTIGQGNNGASSSPGGGGGGGAGAAGSSSGSNIGGAGGNGVASSISGASVTYGGGGGGGASDGTPPATGGAGGTGGGGAGGIDNAAGSNATANTGGGGGGSGSGSHSGGTGGSGIVIIRYATDSDIVATGGTITTDGSDTLHTFTTSGTFTVHVKQSTLTKSLTVPAGHNRALFVIAANYTDEIPASATYNGVAMTSVYSAAVSPGSTDLSFHVFRLLNPSVGTANIVVTWTNPTLNRLLHGFVFDFVDQTTPASGFVSDSDDADTSAVVNLDSTIDYQKMLGLIVSNDATHTQAGTQTVIQAGSNGVGRDSSAYGGGTESYGWTAATDFNIKAPERITTLHPFDIDLLVGTKYTNRNKARVLRWDTVSESWSAEDDLEESAINAFIKDDNYVYVSAGEYGRLYFYNGEQLLPYQRIPGDWSPTQTAVIHQSAVAFLLGVPIFGLSNSAGNPALQGVYGFGSYSKDYPKTLSLDYPISSGNFSGVTIGAILVKGSDLYVAWKDGSSVGVDKLDWSNKYASAYIETVMLSPLNIRSMLKSMARVYADYASLPASTGITFSYKKKHEAAYTALTSTTDAKLCQVRAPGVPEMATLQLKAAFTVSNNNAPEVENIGVDLVANQKQL